MTAIGLSLLTPASSEPDAVYHQVIKTEKATGKTCKQYRLILSKTEAVKRFSNGLPNFRFRARAACTVPKLAT